MRPRNLLFIGSDQHRADALGCAGGRVRTPNLDRLAAGGVRYAQAFCPIAVCTPARASLLTGRWPIHHGALTLYNLSEVRQELDPAVPRWSDALAASGFRTAYLGKWHVASRISPADAGFQEYLPESAYDAWRREAGLTPRPDPGWGGGVDPVPAEQSRLAWFADQAIARLREFAATGERFCLRWDPSEPHLPCVVPEPYASAHAPADVPPWPSFPDPAEGRPPVWRRQRARWGLADWTWDDWAPIVARYFGEVELLDAQIGRVLDELDRLGLAEDTLVVYTSDHGDLNGAHGMFDKHLVMFDDVMRVPLILRWPRGLEAGRVEQGFVTNALDLAATIWGLADGPHPPDLPGADLLSPLPPRDEVFGVYHGGQFGLFSQRMVRTRRWKFVYNPTSEDELYDLATDAGELRNRLNADGAPADDEARAAHDDLRRRLTAWMEAQRDPLLNLWTRRELSPPAG